METPRPYQTPYECGRCFRPHPFKTYHLDLDSDGYVFVSTEIWGVLRSLPFDAGFEINNVVLNPPTQGVGFDDTEKTIDDRPVYPHMADAILLGGS